MWLQKSFSDFYLIVVLLIASGSSCEKMSYPKSSIGLTNESTHQIQFYFAVGGNGGIVYPDTLPVDLNPPFRSVDPNRTAFRDFGFSQEELFEGLTSDTLSLYIFHPDTLARYEWQQIIDDYNILKRYDLSLGDLERLDFKVTYPPDAGMEGIKMYPPE